MNRIILSAAAVCVGGGVWCGGYFMGKSSQEKPVPALDAVAQARLNRANLGLQMNQEAKQGGKNFGPQEMGRILSMPGQVHRMIALSKYYDNLSPSEFESVATNIINEVQGAPSIDTIVNAFLLLSKWGEVDPHAALAFSKKQGEGDDMTSMFILLGWAGKDPENAAAFYKEKSKSGSEGFVRGGGGMMIASEWARADPEAAFKWAKSLTGLDADQALAGVFTTTVNKDLAKSVKMAEELSGDNRDVAIKTIASKWATQDWSATSAWIATLPENEREKAQSRAFKSLASTDPGTARQELGALPEGKKRDEAILSASWDLSEKDPKGTISWVMSASSNENVQAETVRSSMRSWANRNEKEAQAWLTNQPAGNVRDSAAQSFIRSRSTDYVAKAGFAESIQNENTRRSAVEQTGRDWLKTDKPAATQWIQNSQTLTPETKKELLKE